LAPGQVSVIASEPAFTRTVSLSLLWTALSLADASKVVQIHGDLVGASSKTSSSRRWRSGTTI
jgi:hypothetical protein